MKSGNIFIDKEGTDISKIEVKKRNQVLHDYYVMREEAEENNDKFFFVNAQEWEDFFCNIWSSDNPYWEGVDMTYITSLQACAYPQKLIDDISVFESMLEPKSHGGYGYKGHPSTNYVHNQETWEKWHSEFYYEHPEEIDWSGTNGVMPCRKKIIEILLKELLDLQACLDPNGSNNLGLPHPKFLKLKNTNWKNANCETIISEHNDIIIRHQGETLKAYSEKTGALICSVNYYHREIELEELEIENVVKAIGLYPVPFFSLKTTHSPISIKEALPIKNLWHSLHFSNHIHGTKHALTLTSQINEPHNLHETICLADEHWSQRIEPSDSLCQYSLVL